MFWQSLGHQLEGLRDEPHEEPEIIKPKSREMDIGGGFGDTGLTSDDTKWDELSDDSESDDEAAKEKPAEKPTSG